ncbi:MAG: aspartate kinase [Chitinispirillia bacterium]|nr:aspartate kinase [Chitinispirillia bacterium]MCL2242244.1 aspartate kinase [Chitinispirillia bacterium]
MGLIVCKFGGSSVASKERIEQIVRILRMDANRRCVVLSAPGKAAASDAKVTDLLLAAVDKALNRQDYAEPLAAVKARFAAIYEPLGMAKAAIDAALGDLDSRLCSPANHPGKFRDLVVAAGEDLNSRIFAEYLNSAGFRARYVNPKDAGLFVTPTFGDAQPLPEAAANLSELKGICAGEIAVFPGFFGYTADGDVATFSRGGSDLTGAILAEAVDAAEYENWTDVDGIFCAHPHMVDSPAQISALTYKEMRELSYIGFNVLHEEAVRPVMRKKIPIRLRNTNNIANSGTLIVSERLPDERDVVGVASGGGYCSFTLQKFLMNREKGFGRRLLSIFEEMNLSYEHCPSGVDNVSVILDQGQLKPETVNNIIRAFDDKLAPDEVSTEFGIALVSVVGEGLVRKVGVLAQAAGALSKAGVNIKMANQGSSEISMIFGIDASDEKKAVNALYQEFF